MKRETIKLLGTLEVLSEGFRSLVWDTDSQGDFSLWHLLKSEGFVSQSDPELVWEHWQNIERWGTPTEPDGMGYGYAPSRSERKNEDWNEAIAQARQAIYDQLETFLSTHCHTITAYQVSSSHDARELEWQHPPFHVSLLLGELENNHYVCLLPTVPDQVGIHRREDVAAMPETILENLETTDSPLEPRIAEPLKQLLNQLPPLEIYGYYHGGYNYAYPHRIVGAIGSTPSLVFEEALITARMLIAKNATLEVVQSMNGNRSDARLGPFMDQCLQDRTSYSLSFWDVGYRYEVGRTSVNDWIGVRSMGEFEYNP